MTDARMEDHHDLAFKQAANAIYRCKFLLIATGAGFSACSGLPVYNDIANIPIYKEKGFSYHDLARPTMLEGSDSDVSFFYGFWLQCMQQYHRTSPHLGYQILKKWERFLSQKLLLSESLSSILKQRQLEFNSSHGIESRVAQAAFIYTSNVDAHFTKIFNKEQLYEIHGNVFQWQCTDLICAEKHGTWEFPIDLLEQIEIDESSMTIKNEESYHERLLKCKYCGKWTRPNVLLFGDLFWKKHCLKEHMYISWECAVENCLKEITEQNSYPFIILEIGCGQRVPEIRLECENVLRDTFGQSLLIRINASKDDAEHLDDLSLKNYTLPICSTGLFALQKIDFYLEELQRNTATE
jgi:NAD-dependent SIR2 family protein deacetylase